MECQLGLDFDLDILRGFDAISKAKEIGREAYGYLGEVSLPELQLSYVLSALKRKSYDNSLNLRLRRHILLYWMRGLYKTSILNLFIRDCTPAVDVITDDALPFDKPTYLQISGDITRERLRGSISKKNLIFPLIQKPDFIVSGELLTFMGSTKEQQHIMTNYMNRVLEEGIGEVGLVKMNDAKINEKTREDIKKRKIVFDEEEKVMRYEVNGTLFGATRDLEKDEIAYFEKSGFFDRLNIIRWQPSESQFKKQWEHIPS